MGRESDNAFQDSELALAASFGIAAALDNGLPSAASLDTAAEVLVLVERTALAGVDIPVEPPEVLRVDIRPDLLVLPSNHEVLVMAAECTPLAVLPLSEQRKA